VDAYSAFINHFLQARAAVRVATVTRPAFVRYMEVLLKSISVALLFNYLTTFV